jgi:hypothetical protein
MVRGAYLGLPMQDNGKKRTQEAESAGGRAIDVLVNLCVTDVKLHVISIHRYWFVKGLAGKHCTDNV